MIGMEALRRLPCKSLDSTKDLLVPGCLYLMNGVDVIALMAPKTRSSTLHLQVGPSMKLTSEEELSSCQTLTLATMVLLGRRLSALQVVECSLE